VVRKQGSGCDNVYVWRVNGQHPAFRAVRERKGEPEIVKIMRGAMGERDVVKFILVRIWQRGVQTIPSFGFGDRFVVTRFTRDNLLVYFLFNPPKESSAWPQTVYSPKLLI